MEMIMAICFIYGIVSPESSRIDGLVARWQGWPVRICDRSITRC